MRFLSAIYITFPLAVAFPFDCLLYSLYHVYLSSFFLSFSYSWRPSAFVWKRLSPVLHVRLLPFYSIPLPLLGNEIIDPWIQSSGLPQEPIYIYPFTYHNAPSFFFCKSSWVPSETSSGNWSHENFLSSVINKLRFRLINVKPTSWLRWRKYCSIAHGVPQLYLSLSVSLSLSLSLDLSSILLLNQTFCRPSIPKV